MTSDTTSRERVTVRIPTAAGDEMDACLHYPTRLARTPQW
jgi:hypothetical protein